MLRWVGYKADTRGVIRGVYKLYIWGIKKADNITDISSEKKTDIIGVISGWIFKPESQTFLDPGL